jgi:mycofactocin system glycosyltransferase
VSASLDPTAVSVTGYLADLPVDVIQLGGMDILVRRGERRAIRLSPGMQATFRRMAPSARLYGRLQQPLRTDERRLLDVLTGLGMLTRLMELDVDRAPSVAVVVPARDRPREVERCVGALYLLDYPRSRMEVVVVDDGSVDGATALAARDAGARVVRLPKNTGAATARNAGAASVADDVGVLAFVDSDCVVPPNWLRGLLVELADPAVGAVAGRTLSRGWSGPIGRYETVRSPIDLGPYAGDLHPQGFSYVPGTNLLVRRAAFLHVGGFRPELRVGQDVDFCQRLLSEGWRVRYRPGHKVVHDDRGSLPHFVRRRFAYGTTEPNLARLHPSTRRTLPVPLLPLAVLYLTSRVLRRPRGWGLLRASGALLAQAIFVRRFWAPTPAYRKALVGTVRADLRLFGALVGHTSRYHALPLMAAGTLLRLPRLSRLGAASVILAALGNYVSLRPPLDPLRFLLLYATDDLAYAAGVLTGCWRVRSPWAVVGSLRISVGLPRSPAVAGGPSRRRWSQPTRALPFLSDAQQAADLPDSASAFPRRRPPAGKHQ